MSVLVPKNLRQPIKRNFRDFTGQKVGGVIAVQLLGIDPTSQTTYWLCSCPCGKQFPVRGANLHTTQSCGCGQGATAWRRLPILERIRSRLVVKNDCHIWQGSLDEDGYGIITFQGRAWRVHRLLYSLIHGEVPSDKIIRHRCDTPACANPNHLLLGTNLQNIADRNGRNRQAKGETVHTARLTEKTAQKALLWHGKRSAVETAGKFGVRPAVIHRLWRGETWRHLKRA